MVTRRALAQPVTVAAAQLADENLPLKDLLLGAVGSVAGKP